MTIPGSRILIEPTEPIRKLESGLYLPEAFLQKPNTGKVVVTGVDAPPELLNKTVVYNPVIAINIEGKHLIHITDLKFVL